MHDLPPCLLRPYYEIKRDPGLFTTSWTVYDDHGLPCLWATPVQRTNGFDISDNTGEWLFSTYKTQPYLTGGTVVTIRSCESLLLGTIHSPRLFSRAGWRFCDAAGVEVLQLRPPPGLGQVLRQIVPLPPPVFDLHEPDGSWDGQLRAHMSNCEHISFDMPRYGRGMHRTRGCCWAAC